MATFNSKPEWKAISRESAEVKSLCHQWDSLQVEHGLLYRQWVPEQSPSLSVNQLVAPRKLQQAILDHLHSWRTAGCWFFKAVKALQHSAEETGLREREGLPSAGVGRGPHGENGSRLHGTPEDHPQWEPAHFGGDRLLYEVDGGLCSPRSKGGNRCRLSGDTDVLSLWCSSATAQRPGCRLRIKNH